MPNPFALGEIDRGAAANESVNPYSTAAITADSRTALRGSLLSGQSQNPDQVAEAVKLSRTTGAPYEAIQPNLQEVQQGQRLDDYERMIQGHQTTQKFLTLPQNAAMANDDVGSLTAIEKAIRDFGGNRRIQRETPAVMTGREFSEAVRLAKQNNPALDDTAARQLVMQGTQIENVAPLAGNVRGPSAGVESIVRGLAGSAARAPEVFNQGLSYIAGDILGLDTARARNRLSSLETQNIAQTPEFETTTGRGLYGGAVSTIQNAPGIALSVATGSPIPGLALAGLQSSVPAYSKYRERGAGGGMAALGAAGEGAVEVATEMLPMGSLLKVFGKEGKGAAMQFLKSQFQEQWTEQIATAAQDAIDTAIANPDKTWAQYAAERPEAAYQTFLATLVQSGAVTLAHTAAQKASGAAYVASGGAARAEQAAATAEELTKLADASKLRQRDPESFAQFVNQVAEDSDVPSELFIDAETLTNTLNQAGITMERLQMVAPGVAAQMRASSFVPGADIRIPVAEFAAAGADITTPLIDHLRESPEAMSRAEAKTYLETEGDRIQGDVEKELGKATDGQAYQQSVQTVAAHFEDQLNKAGKFRPEVNKAYANLLGNYYASQAARAGMTPQEFMDKYQLRVTSKDVAGQQTLEQGSQRFSEDNRLSNLNAQGASWQRIRAENPELAELGPDDEVTIYRATIGDDIRPDDFVAISKKTLNAELKNVKARDKSSKVVEKRVKVRDLLMGNDATEFVYYPENLSLSQSGIAQAATKTIAPSQEAIDDPKYGVSNVLLALGQNEDLYQYPRSDALDLRDIAADKSFVNKGKTATVQVDDVDKSTAETDLWMLANTTPDDNVEEGTKSWVLTLPTGKRATLTQKNGEVYVNVSGVGEGNGGSAIYDIAANYALNNGLVFVGDPNGVSQSAMRRRLENMLSSAIKYGTTDHLKPHDDQYLGDEAIGVPPLDWTKGDTLGNIRSMVDASIASTERANPVGATLVYNPATSHFEDASTGKALGPQDLWALARADGRVGGAGQAGRTTLQRAALFKSLVQSEGARRTFLESVRRQQDAGGDNPSGALAGTLYQGAVDQTETPAFKAWFGDSKVVDDAGKPLVVYHGTRGNFTTFDYSRIGDQGRAEGAGFYFTNSKDVASGYGEPMEVYLSIKKPMAYDAKPFSKSVIEKLVKRTAELEAAAEGSEIGDGFLSNFGDVYSDGVDRVVREAARLIAADQTALDQLSGMVGSGVNPEYVNKATRDVTGYDGVVANGFSNAGDTDNKIYVAFFPEQIKSATGNRGTFNPNDPSILNQGARANLNFASDITTAPSVIALLDGADLSSFLHESGHFFLEVQADLATRIQSRISAGEAVTPAEQGIVDDMNALLKWFGVTDTSEATALDQWAMKSLDERREAHETFARGFERYAMEGRAPTQELQSIFSKFRSWLLSIYKKLKNLNVTLTDDVRAVMDRMLASNEAIQQAQDARNMGPLFQSPDQAGMTPEEFERYQALGDKATTAATAQLDARLMKDMKWLSRAKAKALKALQAEADELRKETEREVRAEVMSEPVYRAWDFLTGKQDKIAPGTVAPEQMETTASGKLRTSRVKELIPDGWRTLSERRMTSEDRGIDPEIVSEIFGFSSADELVNALVFAEDPGKVISELVDQRMLERYGDITNAEDMDRAADEAVHNELRARVIATELKTIQDAGSIREGKRSTVDVLARAAREFAQGIIDRQLMRNLRPSQYAAAAARSAKLAQQALGKSTEEVALHKRNELINTYATKASYDAQDEVKAAQAYFRKFDKRRKSIDAGYQDQIEQLLEDYDFKPASLKAIDKRKSFAAWYAEQEAAGTAPNVPDNLLNEANRKSYKDMTVEEVRGLRDTIKQIEHLGRLKNKLLLARDKRDFDAIAKEMAESIAEHGGPVRAVNLEGPNPVVDWFAGVGASHRKLASLFRQMDGGQDNGPMYNHIGRAMNERGTMEDVANEKATEALTKIYAPMLKLPGGVTGYRSKVFIPEINDSLTRGGRLSVALNWGNEANRQRVMDGDKWTQGQVEAIIKTLSPQELQFVNKVWDYIDSFWPEIAAKEKRLTGVEPEKVEAAPFVATASDGSRVQMRGGYYPLKYDAGRSDRTETQEAAQAAKEMMQGAMTRATTRRGHTKERLKEVKRAVRKDLNVITQHITQVNHDLAWHEWLIDTNKLLADDSITGAIRDHYGPKVLKTIRDDIMGIATADVVPQTDIDKALLKLRSNVTRATMGASLTTAFLQPFGLTQSMVRIGPKHVLRGMARWGGDAARMESTVGWVRDKSEFMRLRAKTFNKELREIQGAVGGKSKTMKVVDAGLFAMMQKMQMVADIPTWVGQYEKSLGEGLDEEAAIAQADRAVLESQGGGQTKDLSEVQRKHPMLTQFYSYFNVTLNLAAEKTAETDFKNPAAVAGWLGDMALLMVIPAILPSFIMFALKGGDGDDDDMAKRIAQWQLGYLMSTVVGLREFSGATSGFDYAGPPVGRLVVDFGKASKQIAQGEMDEPAVMSIVNLLGTAFGIPTTQSVRSYKGWKAWDEGQEGAGPQSVLFGPPPKD